MGWGWWPALQVARTFPAITRQGPPFCSWQLPETARHAYVLRPLPARARRLNAWHAELRRIFLGIVPVSPARKL